MSITNSVQSLEYAENLLVIFRVDAEAVVRHGKAQKLFGLSANT